MKKINLRFNFNISFFVIALMVLLVNTASAANHGKLSEDVDISQVKEGNIIKATFTAYVDGDNAVKGEQVTLAGIHPFSCAPDQTSQRSVCKKTVELNPGEVGYYILLKYTNQPEQKVSGIVVVDAAPPKIKKIEGPEQAVSSDIVINYEVEDAACTLDGCPGECSGINRVEYWNFHKDSVFKKENSRKININTLQNECTFNSKTDAKYQDAKYKIEVKLDELVDGEQPIAVVAYDNAGNPSAEAQFKVTADKKAPDIKKDLATLHKDGVNFKAFPLNPEGIDAELHVFIAGDDLDTANVVADISKLTQSDSDKNAKATCNQKKDFFECVWNLKLLLPADALSQSSYQASIPLTIKDKRGNSPPKPEDNIIVLTLQKDDKIEVVSLTTQIEAEADGAKQYYARSTGNTITAIFNELSGLSPNNARLKVDDIATSAVPKCEPIKNTQQWKCVWNLDFKGKDKVELALDSSTADIIGNKLSEENLLNTKLLVIVNDAKPSVDTAQIKIKGVRSSGIIVDDVIKGDTLDVKATVKSTVPVTASGDFSQLWQDSASKNVAGKCTKAQEGTWACTWAHGIVVNKQGVTDAPRIVTLKFSNINKETAPPVNVEIKVLGISDGSPDFWDSSAKCYPSVLSRKIGSLTNISSDCVATLTPTSGSNAKTLSIAKSIAKGECEVEGQAEAKVIDKIEIYQNLRGSTNPAFKVSFKKHPESFLVDKVTVTCILDIVSEINGKITQKPEEETISFSFEFEELPFGTLEENYHQQIKEREDEIKKWIDLSNTLKDIMFYSEKICQGFKLYIRIRKAFTACTGVLKPLALIFGILHIPAVGCGEGEESTGYMQRVLEPAVGKSCSYFVNCDNPLWGKEIIKGFGDTPGMSYVVGRPNDQGYGQRVQEWLEPRRSLVLSAATGCIPGIIYNLDKRLQIECLHVKCLKYNLQTKRDPSYCHEERSKSICKYVVGEFFAAVPLVAVYNHLRLFVQQTLSNPFALGAAVIDVGVCHIPLLGNEGGAIWGPCKIWRIVGESSDVVSTIGRMTGVAKDPSNLYKRRGDLDACAGIIKKGEQQ